MTTSMTRTDHFAGGVASAAGGSALSTSQFTSRGSYGADSGRAIPDNPHSDINRSYQARSADLDAQSNTRKAAKREGKAQARTAAGKSPKVAKVKYAKYNPPKIVV